MIIKMTVIRNGSGITFKMLFDPSAQKRVLFIETIWDFVMTSPIPLSAVPSASVEINAGKLRILTKNAFIRPTATPNINVTISAGNQGIFVCNRKAMITPPTMAVYPVDRSITPLIKRQVKPIASIPVLNAVLNIFLMFPSVK